jgi:predicted transcriptional regulator
MDVNMNKSLAQDKVLILYVLSNVKTDVTESDIFKIISPVNNINYFYFKQILADLVDSKLVQTYTKDEDADEKQILYKLTFDGQNSLNLTIDVLPGLLKLKIDNVLKNELNNIISEDSIVTEYIPENENSYTVKCKIVENNKTIFEVRTFAGSNEHAKFIADNWKENASVIYPKILELITGKVDNK